MTGDTLDRLAASAGIEEGWWDFFGEYRLVPAETKRAFLAAMGFAVATEDEVAASLAAVELEPWRSPLEPVLVVSGSEKSPVIVVTLPAALDGETLAWTLEEEIGARHHGSFVPATLPVIEERDVDGVTMRKRALELPAAPQMGIHAFRLALPDRDAVMTLIAAPARAWQPPALEAGNKLWGFTTQLYALKGRGRWGVGDFTDLAHLGRRAAKLGASYIGINPLHGLFPSRPERFSPYSPSSRSFVNIIYIDVEAVPEFAESVAARRLFAAPGFQARLAVADNAKLVDYATIGPAKLALLEACWSHFVGHHLDQSTARGKAFEAFLKQGGAKAWRLATFEALQQHFLEEDAGKGYWRHWPAAYHDPAGNAVAGFAAAHQNRIRFFLYLQWLADEQLAAAQAACLDAGMSIGVYRDLGVGIADDGAEAWAHQDLLSLGVSVGAPPDPLNLAGQDWGLAPFNPIALRKAAYRPLLDVLEANMTHAGAMRLDHAMSLQRLYWVPRGAKADQGAYVRYPVADLFALVALASRRKHCLVIGEDLGTVPDGFRETMDAHGFLGYRLMVFEKNGGGQYKPPAQLAENALVGMGTHDLPSLAGWWQGIDIASRDRLGLYPEPSMGALERAGRETDREAMVEALVAEGLLDPGFRCDKKLAPEDASALAVALYRFMDRAPSRLLMVQFEDVLGLVLQMNLPGTSDQHPNWRLRYPLGLDEMLADKRIAALAHDLAGRKPQSAP